MTGVSLLAPSAAAYRTLVAKSGTSYTSDAYGVVSSVAQGDILDLLNMGCSFLTIAPTGKNNLTSTTTPATTDDTSKDYAAGSLWINTSTNKTYRCVDATASAAVWLEMITASIAQTISAVKTFTAAPAFTVGQSFTGTTGNNILALTDNLADALNVKEGSNSYLKFVTTDSSEAIVAGKVVQLGAGLSSSDNLTMSAAAKGLVLKQGANGKCGTFTCNGSTPVTVSNTSIAVTDTIVISLNTVGGTVGAVPAVKTITASTGFTVAGTASDTSVYNYAIISNAA
jgi:hypothetical protein